MAALIKLDKQTALAELRKISGKTDKPAKFRPVRLLIERIFDSRTPTHKFSLIGVTIEFYRGGLWHLVHAEEKDAYSALEEGLVAILTDRGYREDISTFQEHCLFGSTQPITYAKNPYTPIGILKGNITVEEARQARLLAMVRATVHSYYCLLSLRSEVIALEPLDSSGATIRDPRLINMNRLDEVLAQGVPVEQAINLSVIPFTKSYNFPNARD